MMDIEFVGAWNGSGTIEKESSEKSNHVGAWEREQEPQPLGHICMAVARR